MNTLSKRERLLVAVALGVALLVVVTALTASSGKGGQELAAARRAQADLQRDLDAVKGELNRLQRDVDQRLVRGSKTQLVREMVQSAQGAARAAGLRLTDIKPDEPEVVAGLRRVPVRVSVSTRFPEAARFLFELEQETERFRVEQVRLVATDPQSDRLDLELRLVAFTAADKEKTNARKG